MTLSASKLNRLIAVLIFAGAVFIGQCAHAQPPHMPGPDADLFRMEHLASSLGLSAAQREQMEQAEAANRSRMRAHVKQVVASRHALRGLVEAQRFDEAAATQIAAVHGAAMAAMAVEQARQQHQFRQLLTPEQREKFDHRHHRAGSGE